CPSKPSRASRQPESEDYFNSSSTSTTFSAALSQPRSPKEYEEVSAMLLTVFQAVNLCQQRRNDSIHSASCQAKVLHRPTTQAVSERVLKTCTLGARRGISSAAVDASPAELKSPNTAPP